MVAVAVGLVLLVPASFSAVGQTAAGDEGVIAPARDALRHAVRAREAATAADPMGLLTQANRNLDLADAILRQGHGDDALVSALKTADLAATWQAASLGFVLLVRGQTLRHDAPGDAIRALLAHHGVAVAPDDANAISDLDRDLAEPLRGALTRFVDAFLALQQATELAYDGADLARVHALAMSSLDASGAMDGQALAPSGLDLGAVLAARSSFLATMPDLRDALRNQPRTVACEALELPPAVTIDLTSCDNTHTADVALLLDAGGNDAYRNNAGGSQYLLQGCSALLSPPAAAALVDLGVGADRYGDFAAPRSCGANGGGLNGLGILLDDGGDDIYVAGDWAVNGGGSLGLGLLLDLAGDDSYVAADFATNGGGRVGAGFLLDQAGDDRYHAGSISTNGGASLGGAATLLDRAGNDIYLAGPEHPNGGGSANGGGLVGGRAFLMDEAGDDIYVAEARFANNGGGAAGVGFLYDGSGQDTYVATEAGVNGGSHFAGVGTLLDEAGDDTYRAIGRGANGGSEGLVLGLTFPGLGLLVDRGGIDAYSDDLADCTDCTLAPKGPVGVQWDSDDPPR